VLALVTEASGVSRSGSKKVRWLLAGSAIAVIVAAVAVFTGYWRGQQQAPQMAHVEKKSAPAITVLANEAQPTPSQQPRVHRGDVLGRIEIPRLHVSTKILEGAEEAQLKLGAGHVPSTALPGANGNVAIAAHRDKFFRALRNIRANDEITLHTPHGNYRYVVRRTEIVTPRDVRVLRQTAHAQLTLVTCYPFYFVGHAPKRFIVHADRAS
jgi:sortase A